MCQFQCLTALAVRTSKLVINLRCKVSITEVQWVGYQGEQWSSVPTNLQFVVYRCDTGGWGLMVGLMIHDTWHYSVINLTNQRYFVIWHRVILNMFLFVIFQRCFSHFTVPIFWVHKYACSCDFIPSAAGQSLKNWYTYVYWFPNFALDEDKNKGLHLLEWESCQ